MNMRKRAAMVLGAGALTMAMSTAASATGWCEPQVKCNSGRGNGSETTLANDCDPGNSGGHNNGGD